MEKSIPTIYAINFITTFKFSVTSLWTPESAKITVIPSGPMGRGAYFTATQHNQQKTHDKHKQTNKTKTSFAILLLGWRWFIDWNYMYLSFFCERCEVYSPQ